MLCHLLFSEPNLDYDIRWVDSEHIEVASCLTVGTPARLLFRLYELPAVELLGQEIAGGAESGEGGGASQQPINIHEVAEKIAAINNVKVDLLYCLA